MPPIGYVVAIPLIPLILVAWLVVWALGFWRCEQCGKFYGCFTDRTERGDEDVPDYYCEHCEEVNK